MRIFVGNIAFSTSEFDLEELFGRYGRVSSARIATDRDPGRSRGCGFVDMPGQAEAQAAIEALHSSMFGGRPLTVNEAKPRGEREERDEPRPSRW
jgi:RNA recognition motif-containing protein